MRNKSGRNRAGKLMTQPGDGWIAHEQGDRGLKFLLAGDLWSRERGIPLKGGVTQGHNTKVVRRGKKGGK